MAEERPGPSALAVAAVVVGALAGLFGLASIWSFADHLLYLAEDRGYSEVGAGSVAYVGGEGLLVVAEAVAVVLFTAVSTALLFLRGHAAETGLAICGALAKVLWLVISVAAAWNPGWYFIMDPNGAHQVTIYFFACSIGQAALMVAAAVGVARRPNVTGR